MREFDFAILGAGAIGSILGAHLARAGHRVVMLARGSRATYLEQHGLAIRGLAEFTTAVHTLRDPRALASAGALIVATKTPGTAAALEPLRAAQFDVTLSIQNGPLKNELLAAAFGAERVLGALADTSGELTPSGEVLFTRNVGLYLGELAGGDSARAQHLARTLDAAGVRAAATPEIQTLEWVQVLRLGGAHGAVGDDAGAHLAVSVRSGLGVARRAAGARDGWTGTRARYRPLRPLGPTGREPVRAGRERCGGTDHEDR